MEILVIVLAIITFASFLISRATTKKKNMVQQTQVNQNVTPERPIKIQENTYMSNAKVANFQAKKREMERVQRTETQVKRDQELRKRRVNDRNQNNSSNTVDSFHTFNTYDSVVDSDNERSGRGGSSGGGGSSRSFDYDSPSRSNDYSSGSNDSYDSGSSSSYSSSD